MNDNKNMTGSNWRAGAPRSMNEAYSAMEDRRLATGKMGETRRERVLAVIVAVVIVVLGTAGFFFQATGGWKP